MARFNRSLPLTALAVVIWLIATWPALAQTAPPSDSHHPQGGAPVQAAPPAASPQADAPPAPGGSSSPTMQGGDMPTMGMMHGMMMDMMQQHAMAMAMPGLEIADRIEGRIAFLRAELQVTDAQATAWNAFAQSLRDNAMQLNAKRSAMGRRSGGTPPTLPQRLDQQEDWFVARTEGIRSIKPALSNLYGVLSAEQRKTADQLLPPNLGLMPMGGMMMGMTSGGTPMGRAPASRQP